MNHHIYKYLYEERNKKRIYSSKEYHFFKDYRYLLEENIASINFDKVDDIFDIIKCNVLIKSIINKINLDLIIEEELYLIYLRVKIKKYLSLSLINQLILFIQKNSKI